MYFFVRHGRRTINDDDDDDMNKCSNLLKVSMANAAHVGLRVKQRSVFSKDVGLDRRTLIGLQQFSEAS